MFGFFTKESRISIRKRHLFCFLRGSSTLYCKVYNTERWVLPMNLYALSVNHRVNPLGINSAEQPYFGWKLKSEKPNTMQAAYRLRIYADDTVCFDSGRVETACNALADRWVPDYPVDAKLADTLERCAAQSFDPEHYKTASEEMQSMMNSPLPDSANTSLPITSGCPSHLWTANQGFAGSIARK